ncbi:hypothetical protein [Amycolatopsis sp. CB00013]|uniref:hypothetical protein n=1 Tax=Amycolatopsis sp. CB00013 TaxID=1703945 RepID=UPI0011610FA1|nr:hypothetical protein [Amycolatopsis sp. CB00013]
MSWRSVFFIGATVAILASWAWFLCEQGLDRADKWSSIIGVVISSIIGIIGIIVGLKSLRAARKTPSAGEGHAGTTYNISAGRDSYLAHEMHINKSSEKDDN